MKWSLGLALMLPGLAACTAGTEYQSTGPARGGANGTTDLASARDTGTSGSQSASPPPTSKDAGAPQGTPRANLSTLSAADQQTINDAIASYIRTTQLDVKVVGTDVVPWESTFDFMAPVSVVRAHHAIHHTGEHFFTCHRWYIQKMEQAIGAVLPDGRLPSWQPADPIPPAFRTLVPPTGGDCETLGSLVSVNGAGVACEYAYTNTYTNLNNKLVTVKGLENPNPRIQFPSKYMPGNICKFTTLASLANDIGAGVTTGSGFHNLVHNTIGGTMRTMDSSAAAIFWPWHATVDDIYQAWLDCNITVPDPCPAE